MMSDVRQNAGQSNDILNQLYEIVLQRKQAEAGSSYVASLYAKGLDKVLGKIGEEATEVAIAGKGGIEKEIVSEVADLWFHTIVLLGYYDLPPEQIFTELQRRFGISGLDEKASRSK